MKRLDKNTITRGVITLDPLFHHARETFTHHLPLSRSATLNLFNKLRSPFSCVPISYGAYPVGRQAPDVVTTIVQNQNLLLRYKQSLGFSIQTYTGTR